MLHDVVAKVLVKHLKYFGWKQHLDEFKLTQDQYNAVEDCVVYALDLVAEFEEPAEIFIEQPVYITKDCSGTADLIIAGEHELHIIDWKFGQGIEVSANENVQLMAYACGAYNLHSVQDIHNVMLHVVQPRLDNYDMYSLSLENLLRWENYTLLPGLEEAEKPDAPYVPSLEACRWCPIKTTCKARIKMAFTNAEEIFAEHAKLPEVDPNDIGELIAKAKEVEQVIKDLTQHATKLIMDGKEVRGYKLVAGRSIRKWVDEESAIEFMTSRADFEDLFTQKFISPTQAEKLLGRDAKKDEDFQAQVYKPEGKPTLVPETDKRRALNLTAEHAFCEFKE
jgi:hypothetical protein